MNWDRLYTDAYAHFGCEYIQPMAAMERWPNQRQRDKEIRRRHAEQDAIGDTIRQFKKLVNSASPPKTKREAVKAISPLMGYLLWSIFKVFIVRVIEWAWDQYEIDQRKAGANVGA